MAIHAKRIHPTGSGNYITANSSVAATDLQYTHDNGDVYQATMSKIERVVNYTGGNITVAGVSFAPGTWDFSISGGFDLGSNLTAIAISGGLVTLRQ
jgi:hypothetical protein